jgi:hypothetical protein
MKRYLKFALIAAATVIGALLLYNWRVVIFLTMVLLYTAWHRVFWIGIESSKMIATVENQPWYPRWRQAVQRLILARETLRDTEEGTPARIEAEIEYQAAWSAYKLIADQVWDRLRWRPPRVPVAWRVNMALTQSNRMHLQPAFAMATCIFRCPNTGQKAQGFFADDLDDGDFEAISCTACTRLHWVNPKTGRVLGADEE